MDSNGECPDWRGYLRDIEETTKPTREYKLLSTLQEAHAELLKSDPKADDEPLRFEILAFALREERDGSDTEWGTAFGPMLTTQQEDGRVKEWPGRTAITSEAIEYWSQRADECCHPVLKGRYARLVWDLARIVPQSKPNYLMAQIAVDSAVEVTSRRCFESEIQGVDALKTALRIAHSINDVDRVTTAQNEMIRFEGEVAEDEKAGLWGFSFDCLVEDGLGHPTEEQIDELVGELEARLARLASKDPEKLHPWKAEAAAQRLAGYYRRAGRTEDAARVLSILASVFELRSSRVKPMLAYALLEHIHGVLSSFGLSKEAARVAVKLEETGPAVRDSLKQITVEGSISAKTIRKAIASIVDHEPAEALERLAVSFVPLRERVEKQVREYADRFLLGNLCMTNIKDYSGRTVSQVGSIDVDLEGRIVHQMSQNLQFQGFLLHEVLAEAVRGSIITVENATAFLYESPVFRDEFREIVAHGIGRFLDNDLLSSVHLLVPQIEGAIRGLLEKVGVPTIRPLRHGGGFGLRLLDDMLRDMAIRTILGEDFALYLRVLLTDPRGWNIRNRLCHAALPSAEIGDAIADRVIHALLCMALVREKEEPQSQS